jgi:hypothetical protein
LEKGNKARQVPLLDDLVILLKGYMDEHGLLAMLPQISIVSQQTW